MRRLIMMGLAAIAPLALLAGCGFSTPGEIPSAPAEISDRTTLDEKAGITAEISYTAASKLGTALARNGLIDPVRFKAADARGYAALKAVRAAYDAGNAASFGTAIDNLNQAVAAIRDLAK